MAGLVPATTSFFRGAKDVDARHKAGHDGEQITYRLRESSS
jgi:hypothetical protein